EREEAVVPRIAVHASFDRALDGGVGDGGCERAAPSEQGERERQRRRAHERPRNPARLGARELYAWQPPPASARAHACQGILGHAPTSPRVMFGRRAFSTGERARPGERPGSYQNTG